MENGGGGIELLTHGVVDLAQQCAGIIDPAELIAEQRSRTGFGPVGDQFNGIDEMLRVWLF